ncbi:MAG: SAM-dependent chlorinase/fluorinase [Bacteroidia bacterium]|nr:SAM-dependent chlorinase/fluorinase [Bacteroidia bacterium]
MPIVTLTSDMGHDNHYAAVVKGILLSLRPGLTLVDVTHTVANYDLLQAAFIVQHAAPAFPAETIHLIAVDPDLSDGGQGVVMRYRDQWFVGPNNGILTLISNGEVREAIDIQREDLLIRSYPPSFRAARVFAPAAAFLAGGGAAAELGPQVALRDLRWGEPVSNGHSLRGKIIHIDKFGNAITNIRRDGFLHMKQGRRFEIIIRNVRLRRIVNAYSDVARADALALFGESNNLEIAMREASAAELLGLKVHDMITIEFLV